MISAVDPRLPPAPGGGLELERPVGLVRRAQQVCAELAALAEGDLLTLPEVLDPVVDPALADARLSTCAGVYPSES